MYKKFFGLSDNPFNIVPDPRFLFSTARTDETFANLIYGVQSHKGIILLTGEVGTGKTVLLKKLVDGLHREAVATAFVFNPKLNPTEFFDYVLSDFGIPHDGKVKPQMAKMLYEWLLERHHRSQTSALIVDEAHDLSDEVLEAIRLLSNLETPTDKLLQIVLSGQPEFEEKLLQPEIRLFRQRIALRQQTSALSATETADYIAHRIRVANGDPARVFTPEATASVFRFSRGIPRVINLLCEHALVSAYVDEEMPAGAGKVEEAADQFLPVPEVVPSGRTPGEPAGSPRLGSLASPPKKAAAAASASAPLKQQAIPSKQPEARTSREGHARPPSPGTAIPLRMQTQIAAHASSGVRAGNQGPTLQPKGEAKPAGDPVPRGSSPNGVQPEGLPAIVHAVPSRARTDSESPALNPIKNTNDAEKPVPRPTRAEPVRTDKPGQDHRSPSSQIPGRTSGSPLSQSVHTPIPKEAPSHAHTSEPGDGSEQHPHVVKKVPSAPVRPQSGEPNSSSEEHLTGLLWIAVVLIAVGIGLGGYFVYNRNPSGQLNKSQGQTSRKQTPAAADAPANLPAPTTTQKSPATPATSQNEAGIPTARKATNQEVSGDNRIPTHTRPEQPQDVASTREPEKARETSQEAREAEPPRTAASVETPHPASSPSGRLLVTSSVSGAAITLDGQSQSGWTTPHTFTDLRAGPHEVTISKPGYREIRQTVNVEASQLMIADATLVPPGGELVFSTNPAGAEIAIDGRSYGPSPVHINVGVGQHSFSASLAGRKTVGGNVTVEDQAVVTRRLDLPPATVAPPTKNVKVTTDPPKATVYADGSPKGVTPLSFHMPPGRHTLIIYASGFQPVRREIEVPENNVVTVTESLATR